MTPLSLLPPPWKIGTALVLAAALVAGAASYHHHVFAQGEAHDKARSDAVIAANTLAVTKELLAINGRVRVAQAELAKAQEDLQRLQQENDREKAISSDRQRRLLAGDERMSVLTRARPSDPAQAGPAAGAAASTVDPGAGVVYDLDPAVAAGLEGIRAGHNDAVNRLGACILAYDKVKTAADAP
jgi:hypothetical protein